MNGSILNIVYLIIIAIAVAIILFIVSTVRTDPGQEIDVTGRKARVAVEIHPGWTLIGVPQEVDLSRSFITAKLKDYGGNKAWYYFPADDKYYGTNYLRPGTGYWVEGEARATEYAGNQTADVTIELVKGWNLISVPRETPIQEMDQQIKLKAAGLYKAWYFYPPDGVYYGSSYLVPGWGYWVEVEEKGTVKIRNKR